MNNLIIIVAGGRGKRFESQTPKQFLPLGSQLILMHTIEAFYRFDPKATLRIVLPQDYINDWKNWCTEYHFTIPHEWVVGGKERFDSVKNALKANDHFDFVFVHDGARPLIDQDTINRCLLGAQQHGTAIPCVALTDSLRQLQTPYTLEASNQAVDRSHYVAIQTPQVFRFDWFVAGYQQNYTPSFTDDASVIERLGHPMHLVEGNSNNIKVTVARDLKWCQEMINAD